MVDIRAASDIHTDRSNIILMGMENKKRKPDQQKRHAILVAAGELFLRDGFSETSMDAVAARAKVTKQTVYSHYQNKETLFASMLTELCKSNIPFDRLRGQEKPFKDMLYDIGLGYVNLISGKEALNATRLIMAEAPKRPKLAKMFYESSTERMTLWLADFLEEQCAKGVVSIPNCRSAASYFFSLLKGRYHLKMALCVKPPPSQDEKLAHLRENVEIFMRLFTGPDAMKTESIL